MIWRKLSIGCLSICLLLCGRTESLVAGVNQWTPVGSTNNSAISLAIHPRDHSFITGSLYNGAFRSQDNGKTWQQFSPVPASTSRVNPLSSSTVPAILIHPLDPDIIYIGSIGGLWKTQDNGETWQKILDQAVYTVVYDIKNPSTLYAGTADGIFKSIDQGETWEQASNGLTNEKDINPYVQTLIVDPRNPETLYAVASRRDKLPFLVRTGKSTTFQIPFGDEFKDSSYGLFMSQDRGKSWQRIGAGIPDSPGYYPTGTLAMEVSDSSILYFTTPLDLFRSKDGGQHFHLLTTPKLEDEPWDSIHHILSIQVPTPRLYAVVFDSGIFQSCDRGDSWNPMNFNLPLPVGRGPLIPSPTSSETLYLKIRGKLWNYTLRGSDFNEDGVLDFEDFISFAGKFGLKDSDTGFDSRFDMDGNNRIDFLDFLILVRGYQMNK